MFSKILIANRGEIACRVMRTAHRLGIATVAVYSEADREAMHVHMADEAIFIGPAPASESYLIGERIIDAARQTGAEAIHPGYGFLSENAEFCRACEEAEIVFIGPPVGAIKAMGSKSAAKRIMGDAEVPLVPGYHGEDQSPDALLEHAKQIGFPVLLKAVAGGGGKGMRQVDGPEQFTAELEAAQREARSSFGNGDMLVEKYLARPRHVEVQVFCDSHGNGVYLGDRDCSIQRRHQKVIEEAPAPGLSDDLRRQMGESAVQAARAIDYRGAGTVEFLLDEDGSFYFMEMNTRLQVEHPVTELVTGQDLVEWQLSVAAGEPLPLSQQEVTIKGHALEARIYAEDPKQEFLPATGKLTFLRSPEESVHVRVDTGVRQGDEVTVHYDPMIAKLVTWDASREQAARRLATALSAYRVAGLTTNIDFLYNISTAEPFLQAELDTGFIEKHRDVIFHEGSVDATEEQALAALLVLLKGDQDSRRAAQESPDPSSPWHAHTGWRMNEPHLHRFTLLKGEDEFEIAAEQLGRGDQVLYELKLGERKMRAQGSLEGEVFRADIDGFRQKLQVTELGGDWSCYRRDGVFHFRVKDAGGIEQASAGPGGNPRAPMNGVVVSLLVEPGARVEADTPLLVMEAMKMEHTIKAPAAGLVTEFFCEAGELVDGDAELLNFEVEE